MTNKTIEIYYDIADIPGGSKRSLFCSAALDFRNAAMEHIERALTEAGAGEWSGAEIGGGEVNFGFDVEDFDRAEAVIRDAVKGTRFDCIREIERNTFTEEDMAAAAEMMVGPAPAKVRLMIALALPFAFLFLLIRVLTLPLRLIARRS